MAGWGFSADAWHSQSLLLMGILLAAAACLSDAVSQSLSGAGSTSSADSNSRFQSIPALPGCSGDSSSSSQRRVLTPELQHCSWSVQMQRQSSRWYAFEIGPESADNMSVVIMARAVSGQITMALWGPGSDPYRSVPTQVGTNYMEWPGLREVDQDEGQAGGGHASLASEQQYLFLSHRNNKPLLVGQYVVVVEADMGQPLVSVEVSTPSSMTQLVPDEQEALKDLVRSCCLGLAPPGSTEALAAEAAAAAGLGSLSGWCSSVGNAVTYDLREWYADICHVAPNVCSRDGHLQRLVLPPYALRCSAFPKALSKFTELRHLDMSYSVAPGTLADMASVLENLKELRQLHLRGVGLSGPFSCELMEAARQLEVLSLSDNDKLSGSLPPCWLSHSTLQELQLAGLSDLHGPLPDATQGLSSTSEGDAQNRGPGSEQLCGFGKLKYVNLAGIIGDAGLGFTGTLPAALGFCDDLLYLDLSGHSLSGSLPALPPNIQFLNLSSNGLSSSLPEFAVDAALQYLDLSFNRFTGTLQDMTLLPMLDWLDLSDNSLTGPLPPLPPSVRWVDLSNNQFTGGLKLPVPPRHADEELALVLFNVANNRLTGSIPAAFGSQAHLAFLDVSHNQLTGGLQDFAKSLAPQNSLLQINFSSNQLAGEIPAQLQNLAAVRPVLITMRDGFTPVTRIFDLSNNQLAGTFPAWLVTNVPLLVSSCQCSLGIYLDSPKFTCPKTLPRLSRDAQNILRRFEFLQCVTDDSGSAGSMMAAMMGGGSSGTRQVPVWQIAAGGTGRSSMMSRAEHKAMMQRQWDLQQQQQGSGWLGSGKHKGTLAGVVLGVVAVMLLTAAVVLMAVRRRSPCRPHGSGKDQRGPSTSNYTLLPDYSTYTPPAGPADASSSSSSATSSTDGQDSPLCLDGSPTASAHSLASSASSGSGGTRSSRGSSCGGDGMCEIALVLRSPTASATADGTEEAGYGPDGHPPLSNFAGKGMDDDFLV